MKAVSPVHVVGDVQPEAQVVPPVSGENELKAREAPEREGAVPAVYQARMS